MLKTKATIDEIGKEIVDFLSDYITIKRLTRFITWAIKTLKKSSA